MGTPDISGDLVPPAVERNADKLFIGGEWVASSGTRTFEVVNPATEEPIARVALGEAADVDRAVAAARAAFPAFSQTTREERLELLDAIIAEYDRRAEDLAQAVRLEMGAPVSVARNMQVPVGAWHFQATRAALETFVFEETLGTSSVVREPIGVCALITPWNWPLNQIVCKVAPALAAGCTMVLKPAEVTSLDALIFAEVLADAGVPAGVFNLVNGDGPTVGRALAAHPDVDLVSFTGSTRAGVDIATTAAPTVKRVTQELGGKSANILLDDVDMAQTIARDLAGVFLNSGQSCGAGTRILVPKSRMDEAVAAAREAVEATVVGSPADAETAVGPVVSSTQFERIQSYIQQGIDEGATVVAGGPGRPDGLERGFYVKPTVFADVDNDMTIAREEIFGPVVVLIGYDDEDDAVRIANDSEYGLGGLVSSNDIERARRVARRMRTGLVQINGAPWDMNAPFGGYKRSGNGREWGAYGMEEYLETKALAGDVPA